MNFNANFSRDAHCEYFNITEEDLVFLLKNYNPSKWQYTFISDNWRVYLHRKNTIRDNWDLF